MSVDTVTLTGHSGLLWQRTVSTVTVKFLSFQHRNLALAALDCELGAWITAGILLPTLFTVKRSPDSKARRSHSIANSKRWHSSLLTNSANNHQNTMTSGHRSLARLPLEIFEGLHVAVGCTADAATEEIRTRAKKNGTLSAEELRREIVSKLAASVSASSTSSFYRSNKRRKTVSETQDLLQQQHHNPNSNNINSGTQTSNMMTVGTFLRLVPVSHLMKILDPLLTYGECIELYRRICLQSAPQSVTASTLLTQTMSRISTGLAPLDAALGGGGMIRGSITEVVGSAGTAKTQLALQAMTLVLRSTDKADSNNNSSAGGSSIFVDTEQKVSLHRLAEMARERGMVPNSVLHRVRVHSPGTLQELSAVLQGLEDEIVEMNMTASAPVQLLVIDSIAAPARRDNIGSSSAATQAAAVLQIAQTLKRLADQFHLCVLVINQVGSSSTAMIDGAGPNSGRATDGTTRSTAMATAGSGNTKAALGMAWHHCVSTRIQLDHSHTTSSHDDKNVLTRTATILKSNLVSPSAPIPFQVTAQGLVPV
jgi:RecA/RadA recombinase